MNDFDAIIVGARISGPAKRTGLATHMAFDVADLEAARQHLERQGVEIVGGPMARGDGVMQLYVHDPDGYLIELFQWQEGAAGGGPEWSAVRGQEGAAEEGPERSAVRGL